MARVVKRSQRLQVVLQLAQRSEDSSAEALRDAQNQQLQAQAQLDQIRHYKSEYIQEVDAKTLGLTAQAMINDRQFIGQLTQLEKQQQIKLQQMQQLHDNARHNWQVCRNRRRNLEQLIHKSTQEENREADKQLQKLLDESALRVYQREERE